MRKGAKITIANSYLIVTNNPLVLEKLSGETIKYYDETTEQILIRVRDFVYEGHALISHPLPASIRMVISPYRSVMIGAALEKPDPEHAEIAGESLRKFRQCYRPVTTGLSDYQFIDMQLLLAAIKEHKTV